MATSINARKRTHPDISLALAQSHKRPRPGSPTINLASTAAPSVAQPSPPSSPPTLIGSVSPAASLSNVSFASDISEISFLSSIDLANDSEYDGYPLSNDWEYERDVNPLRCSSPVDSGGSLDQRLPLSDDQILTWLGSDSDYEQEVNPLRSPSPVDSGGEFDQGLPLLDDQIITWPGCDSHSGSTLLSDGAHNSSDTYLRLVTPPNGDLSLDGHSDDESDSEHLKRILPPVDDQILTWLGNDFDSGSTSLSDDDFDNPSENYLRLVASSDHGPSPGDNSDEESDSEDLQRVLEHNERVSEAMDMAIADGERVFAHSAKIIENNIRTIQNNNRKGLENHSKLTENYERATRRHRRILESTARAVKKTDLARENIARVTERLTKLVQARI